MADYNSSLPVRTQNDGDIVSKIADSLVPAQQVEVDSSRRLSVKVNDSLPAGDNNIGNVDLASSIPAGTNNIGKVDIEASLPAGDNNIGNVDIASAIPAGDNNIGNVDIVTEPATAADGGALPAVVKVVGGYDGSVVQALSTDANGRANVNVVDSLPAGNNNIGDVDVASLPGGLRGYAEDAAHASGDIGAMALAVRKDTGAALAGADGDYAPLQVDAIGNLRTRLYDGAGAAAGVVGNPLQVAIDASAGDPIHDYNTSSALAAAASSNHDYTVTALKTLYVKAIKATGSGKMKIEVQEEDSAGGGTYTTKAVAFNSTATPNIDLVFEQPLEVEAGKKIRVIRTNRDNQAQDVYSTIVGAEF